MAAPTLKGNWWRELQDLEAGWDSYGGKRITTEALTALGSFSVVPCSDGGIQLEVHRDGWDIEICIGAGGRIESALTCCDSAKGGK